MLRSKNHPTLLNIPKNNPVDEAEVREPVRQVPQVQHVLFQPLLNQPVGTLRKNTQK